MDPVLRWPGNALRFIEITLVALMCGLVYGVLRLGSLFIFDRERRRARVARIRGKVTRWAMASLGATFIKLGQVMSTRPDLFPPEMIAELRRLQDSLPPFRFGRARAIIEAELGRSLEEAYRDFDRRPVAAASVAQVHRATLPDGREVAVKVLRPGVRKRIERDGRIILTLAKLAALRPKVRLSDPVGHTRAFVDGIISQTDLRLEAEHYEMFRKNFDGYAGVVFPQVYPGHSAERVLTMSFMRGRKIDRLGDGPHPVLARLCRNLFFKMCYQDGLVHADLHPGNMLVNDDDSLTIFDVGLVKNLGPEFMVQLVDFSRCVAMGTTVDFVNHLRRFHRYMEDVDWAEVERDAEGFVSRFRNLNVAELEMGQFVNEVFAIARKHRIRPIPEMTLVLVGVVTAEGISKMLDPHVNTFHEMAVFLMPLIQKYGLDRRPLETWLEEVDDVMAVEGAAAPN